MALGSRDAVLLDCGGTSTVMCLAGLVSKMTCYVSGAGTLNPTTLTQTTHTLRNT